MTRTRQLITAVALAAIVLLAPGAGQAIGEQGGGGGDNVVLVFNEADGIHRTGSGVAVSITGSDTVGSENLAYAKSSCTGCRTVAVAMQTVLITRDASVIQPKNLALAVNAGCTSCRTMAAAYQYVLTTGGPVALSADGRHEVAQIQADARAAAASGLPFPELEARLDEIAERFRQVIDEELRLVGRGGSLTKDVARDSG